MLGVWRLRIPCIPFPGSAHETRQSFRPHRAAQSGGCSHLPRCPRPGIRVTRRGVSTRPRAQDNGSTVAHKPYLDHLGAEIGKQHPAIWAGEQPCQFQDSNAIEWPSADILSPGFCHVLKIYLLF